MKISHRAFNLRHYFVRFSLACSQSIRRFLWGITNDSDGTDPNRCRVRGEEVWVCMCECSFYKFSTIRNGSLLIIYVSNAAFLPLLLLLARNKVILRVHPLGFSFAFTPSFLLALTLSSSLSIKFIESFLFVQLALVAMMRNTQMNWLCHYYVIAAIVFSLTEHIFGWNRGRGASACVQFLEFRNYVNLRSHRKSIHPFRCTHKLKFSFWIPNRKLFTMK